MQSLSSTLITVGSGLAIIGAAGIVGLYASIKVAKEYERQVRMTATQVTGFTVTLDQLGEVGLNVAKNIAVPFEQIQPALYDIFSSTNANLSEATILLEGFAKTAVAGQVSIQDASRGTIPILNAFNIPLSRVNEVLDIQFQLVRKGVGTYDEFSKVFGRVVPSATRAHQSFQEVAAMLAYLTRNGLSAAMASSSAARALDALSNPKAVGNMEDLGIKVRDLKGQLLPLETVLFNVRKYLNSLPEKDRVGALVELFKGAGGTIQARRFLDQILLRPGELEEFVGFLGDMKDSSGAFGEAYAIMSGSVAAQTEILKNNFKVLEEFMGRTISPIFSKVIGFLARMLQQFNDLSPSTKKFITISLLVLSAMTLLSGVVIVVLGVLAGLYAAISTAGIAFFILLGAIGLVVAAVIGLGVGFYIAWQKSQRFRDFIVDIGRKFQWLYDTVIKPTAIAIWKAFETYLYPPFHSLYVLFRDQVIPTVKHFIDDVWKQLEPGFIKVGAIIREAAEKSFQFLGWVLRTILIPAIEWLTEKYHQHKEAIDKVAAILGGMVLIVLTLGALLGTAGLTLIVANIIIVFAAFAVVLGAIIEAIQWIIDRIKDLIEWLGRLIGKTAEALKPLQKIVDITSGVFGVNSVSGAGDGAGGAIGSRLLPDIPRLKSAYESAGKAASQGWLQGATSMLPSTARLASQTYSTFSSTLTANKFTILGNVLGGAFATGLRSATGFVGQAAAALAQTAYNNLLIKGVAKQSITLQQNITLHTQSVTPSKTAAELGLLLAAR
jgi:TP901 family phage tail tape measure protein